MNEAQVFSLHLVAGTPLVHRPDFLASLAEQRDHRFQVVIIDGGEKEAIEPALGIDVIQLRNFRETSYAKGHNQAIAFALQRWPREQWQERFVVLTRAETVFHPGCLEAFSRAFSEDPTLAIAGPKVLLAEPQARTDQEIGEMQMTQIVYEMGYACRKDRHLHFISAGEKNVEDVASREVFGCSEPCLVIRASALDALLESPDCWVDEALPRGQELIDVCWRAHMAGLSVKVIPSACAWFIPSEAREQPEARRGFYLAGPVREKNDWVILELLHLPWVVWSMVRSGLSLITHPGRLLVRLKSWHVWRRLRHSPSVQKERKRVSVAEMYRWFV